ncbi:CehA/McbA family metallohydrolase [Pseudoduganella albidiflava]|uniref:PHP domain-containing protein n=1 Tax=Pseudoduganella albidiflava TaxID=321983 RepID=A0A411X590_9BURK|nr:CehA/McbA family metallohydrolase [Pseudoduganella albidiflava]QBI04084.1 PHP domain-containing protein [Pseudoduganella albidiflava]GGY24569.1 phosphoesterase [Pseudoduganella albidiflava]
MRFERLAGLAILLCGLLEQAAAQSTDLVLHGRLTGTDHQTYREVPFAVPPGVDRVTVTFDYTGREQRSVIDLGLIGPDGMPRGWSGGNKRTFTVGTVDATPSYLAVPALAGQWALLLGIPNMRANATADYTATVTFSRGQASDDAALATGARWYRGDLHSHTGHSDGSCRNRGGSASVPCPPFVLAQAAAARRLDFLAVTEHNTVSHAQALGELQPYFDTLLLMPGREITTFHGHANLFGTLAPLDFRRGWDTVLKDAQALRGLVSINHPVRPSGEDCMGCGWDTRTDMALVQAIEAVNGKDAGTRWSGIPFWEAQLDRGYRITAIGGSDSHRPDESPPGIPATVVHAAALSQSAILDGIRKGHVFVDIEGSPDRLLDVRAEANGNTAMMGDALDAPAGTAVRFRVRTAGVAGARLRIVDNGREITPLADPTVRDVDSVFTLAGDGRPHWVRVDVIAAAGHLLLLGNPVYLNARR